MSRHKSKKKIYKSKKKYRKKSKIKKNQKGGTILRGEKDVSKFYNLISPYIKKKDYVLICSGGPSLNDIKDKTRFNSDFFKNAHVISNKNSIILLKQLGIPIDFFVTNHFGSAFDIDTKYLNDKKQINICHSFHQDKIIDINWDFIINFKGKEPHKTTECAKLNLKNCLEFKKENNQLNTPSQYPGPGTMIEIALPLALLLKPKKIIMMGWDVNSKFPSKFDGSNYNILPHISNADEDAKQQHLLYEEKLVKEGSTNLATYIKKNYDIDLYKTSNLSALNIPIFDASNEIKYTNLNEYNSNKIWKNSPDVIIKGHTLNLLNNENIDLVCSGPSSNNVKLNTNIIITANASILNKNINYKHNKTIIPVFRKGYHQFLTEENFKNSDIKKILDKIVFDLKYCILQYDPNLQKQFNIMTNYIKIKFPKIKILKLDYEINKKTVLSIGMRALKFAIENNVNKIYVSGIEHCHGETYEYNKYLSTPNLNIYNDSIGYKSVNKIKDLIGYKERHLDAETDFLENISLENLQKIIPNKNSGLHRYFIDNKYYNIIKSYNSNITSS